MMDRINRGTIAAGVLVASTIGLMLLVFSIFEEAVGHGIAIASMAATATIVVFQSNSRAGQPKTIAVGYIVAAAIGVVSGYFFESSALLQIGVGVTTLVVLLAGLNMMHPPAVAYLFGFILGDYGFLEFFLTLMALAAFFVSLAIMVFLLEQIFLLFGSTKVKKKRPKPKNHIESIESAIDRTVPFALVFLFASILSQFLYPEILEAYDSYLNALDNVIIILLVIDLLFKFRRAKSAGSFLRYYWLEIIAVIPFFFIMRAFQGVMVSLEFLSKGAISASLMSGAVLRFLRPMARFPRFLRMLNNLETLTKLENK